MRTLLAIFFVFVTSFSPAQTWSAVGSGLDNAYERIQAMCVYNGELYVGGYFHSVAGMPVNSLVKWNGATWDSVPGMMGFGDLEIFDIEVYNNELVIVGNQRHAWNGTTWHNLGLWVNSPQYGSEVFNNELYIGGRFTNAGGTPTRGIARWNGTTWDSVGCGGFNVNSPFQYTGAAFTTFNGELYVAGEFGTIDSIATSGIARWDGNTWNTVGGSSIWATQGWSCLETYNNKVYAGGEMNMNGNIFNQYIGCWNGLAWDTVGHNLNESPTCMAVYNDQLYVGGWFDTAGYQPALAIAMWNDTSWNPVGSGMDLMHIHQDTMVFGSDTTFIALENIYCMCVYNNELYVAGTFTQMGGVPVNSIARWHEIGASIEEFPTAIPVDIFPNPSGSATNFQFMDNSTRTIVVTDNLGREIWRKETDEMTVEFPAIEFGDGMYFYTITQVGFSPSAGKFLIAN